MGENRWEMETKVRNRVNSFKEVYNKPYNEDFPNIIDIELTNHCNLNCLMCSRQFMTRKEGYMSEEIFKRIIDTCQKHNTAIRLIRWGEPFLHPNILEWCKYVKSKGLLLHITTNGVLLTEKDLEKILKIGIDSIIFSLQGTDQEGYEYMRDNRKYQKLVNTISKLLRMRKDGDKPFIHISTTVTDESQEEIDEFTEFWENTIGVDSVGVGKTNLSRFEEDNMIGVDTGKKEYIPCNEVFTKLSVDWDGKITACCGDYDNLLTIGHVDDGIEEVWNGKRLECIRHILDNMDHRMLTLCNKCYSAHGNFNNNHSS